jgi:hypothetical protein
MSQNLCVGCTAHGKTDALTARPMRQANVYRMVRRRAKAAGIQTKIGCHTFRAQPSSRHP